MVDFEVSKQNERDITNTLLETSRDSMTSRVKYILTYLFIEVFLVDNLTPLDFIRLLIR